MIISVTRCSVVEDSHVLKRLRYIGLTKYVNQNTLPVISLAMIQRLVSIAISILYKLNISNIIGKLLYCTILFLISANLIKAQSENFDAGSFIINMGVTPQTELNALRPYGMIYDLIKNNNVKIKWSINPSKGKDGIDFTHNGTSYKGGTFIIPKEYVTAAVQNRITYWLGQGVVGQYAVSNFSAPIDPVYGTLYNVPRWTLDMRNGKLAVEYFKNALIPQDAYGGDDGSGWKDPADLDCCDDLFVLPHAEPSWVVHNRLYSWNLECKGGLWDGCTSGSAIENMVNPSNRNEQTNFLTEKDPAYTSTSGIYANSNSLMLWGTHNDGTPPYNHRLPADPVAQYIGTTDAAHTNGAEQIYIPRQTAGTSARWRPTTKIIVYDPVQNNVSSVASDLKNAAATMVYGRGFGDNNRGYVMHSSGHSYDKKEINPAHVAAQRAFFNFSWLVARDKAELITILLESSASTYSGDGKNLSFNLPNGSPSSYNILWSSTCGGTFTPDPTQQSLQFIPPASGNISDCVVTVSITDQCGRTSVNSTKLSVLCDYNVNYTKSNVSCFNGNNGSITLQYSGVSAVGENSYQWQKEGLSTINNGTNNTIGNLSAGTYHITVTSASGCSKNLSVLISQPFQLTAAASGINYSCNNQSGSIKVEAAGGSLPYNYNWNNGRTTSLVDNVIAGNYAVTVTDNKGCTAIATTNVMGPTTSMEVNVVKEEPSCTNFNDASILLQVTGGTSPYGYYWSDGNVDQNRLNIVAGQYYVTITDANGCTLDTFYSLLNPPPITVNANIIAPSCTNVQGGINSTDGQILLTVGGGTPTYSYSWDNGTTVKDRLNVEIGVYTVTVTDSNGCLFIKTYNLVSPNSPPSNPTNIDE